MKHERGFTMIELIVYIGLLSILIAVMGQVFLATLSLKIESEAANSVQQDGRYIISRLTYDIRRAKSIDSPLLGQSADELVLTITENGTDTTYRYATGAGSMVLTSGGVSSPINGSGTDISGFTVTRIGNSGTITDAKDTVEIDLTVRDTTEVQAGGKELDLHTSVGLR